MARFKTDTEKKEYIRDKMREYRAQKPERVCPECNSRTLEKHQKYCSECSEIKKRLTDDICHHNWKLKRPDYYKTRWIFTKMLKKLEKTPDFKKI